MCCKRELAIGYTLVYIEIIPNFKEILSLHTSQEMKHSEGVKPIRGLVYMCQHVLWIILRYFSSSLKIILKLLKTGIP